MPEGRIIALLTDFGLNDNYVGVMKAVIAGINPAAHVIDISHGVRPQDVPGAAFLLGSSYKFFPKDTIFVSVVDPGVGGERKIVCVQTGDHIFLAPDNGVLEPVMAREEAVRLVDVSNDRFFLPEVSSTFHGRDIFAPVAAHLSLGVSPSQLGDRLTALKRLNIPRPGTSVDGTLRGEVLYIDRFGNLITSIDHEMIKKAGSRVTCVTIGGRRVGGLSAAYRDGGPGEPVALIGSAGYLEVAVNGGSACELLGCTRGDEVIVAFDRG